MDIKYNLKKYNTLNKYFYYLHHCYEMHKCH